MQDRNTYQWGFYKSHCCIPIKERHTVIISHDLSHHNTLWAGLDSHTQHKSICHLQILETPIRFHFKANSTFTRLPDLTNHVHHSKVIKHYIATHRTQTLVPYMKLLCKIHSTNTTYEVFRLYPSYVYST